MRRALALTALIALAACGDSQEDMNVANTHAAASGTAAVAESEDGRIGIRNAQVRLPAVAGRPGAAYFELINNGAALTLASVTTGKAERAEIHESKMEGGVMRMERLDALPLPANATTALAPGGKHIMLFDLDPALKAGDKIALTLEFADGTSMSIVANARTVGGDAAHSGH